MMQVLPDENERAGGYGFLVFSAEGVDPAKPTTVELFETFGGRWLGRSDGDGVRMSAGDANWQTVPHPFGPYPVTVADGMARVRIGPEIINKVPEYTHCRITVGPVMADVIWPDDVIPRAGAAALGGITTIARPVPMTTAHEPIVPPVAGPEDNSAIDQVLAEAPAAPSGKGKRLVVAVLGALALALVIAVVVLQSDKESAELPPAETATPVPDPVEPAPTKPEVVAATAPAEVGQPLPGACAPDYLTSTAPSFAALYPLLDACRGQLSPDAVFEMLERARAAGDPDALLRFGHLYDPGVEDPVLETGIGLGAPANLPQAVEYYSQSKAKGSSDALAALTDACTRLAEDPSTLSQGAFDDFCR